MDSFVVSHDSRLSPEAAWARLVDWPSHAKYVPLTSIRVTTAPPNGVGTVFVARTGIGRLGFDDPMEVTQWAPPSGDVPGRCRLEKRGSVMAGWAELSVQPRSTGSRATWREQVSVRALPRFSGGPARLSGRLLFGRVLRRLLADPPG